VRFLDVHSALLSLAATAGEQLTTNMQRWAPAAQHLNLTHVLAHHRKTALQLAAQQQASCRVDPNQPGDYQGTCKGAADCRSCASSSGSSEGSKGVHSIDEAAGSSGSEEDDIPMSEKMRKMEELAGVETSTSSSGGETRDTQGSAGGKDEVRVERRATQLHSLMQQEKGRGGGHLLSADRWGSASVVSQHAGQRRRQDRGALHAEQLPSLIVLA
jgi:hypothetical protein